MLLFEYGIFFGIVVGLGFDLLLLLSSYKQQMNIVMNKGVSYIRSNYVNIILYFLLFSTFVIHSVMFVRMAFLYAYGCGGYGNGEHPFTDQQINFPGFFFLAEDYSGSSSQVDDDYFTIILAHDCIWNLSIYYVATWLILGLQIYVVKRLWYAAKDSQSNRLFVIGLISNVALHIIF